MTVVEVEVTKTIIITTERELGSFPLAEVHRAALIVTLDNEVYTVVKSRFLASGQKLNRAEFKDYIYSFLDYI